MPLTKLRPTFWRLGAGRAWSGWYHPTSHNDVWFDIWSEVATLHAAALSVRDVQPSLALDLMSIVPNEHGLCVVPRARPAFVTGEHLEFTRDVDLHPVDTIRKGERAVAARYCRNSGIVELFMSYYHARLNEHSNCVTLEPHCSDDVLDALQLFSDPFTAPYATTTPKPVGPNRVAA